MEIHHTDYSTNLAAHAQLLKEFFSALFDPKDTVYIYPRLRPGSPLTLRSGLIPDELQTEGRVVSRKPSSTTTKTLARLHELNAQGYDIYFCVNPLIHHRRCQKGVLKARNVLVEMDEADLDTQREMLERFRHNIKTAVYTGGKSIHMMINLSPSLWNPNRVSRKLIPKLKKGRTSARWPQYINLANQWINRFEMLGEVVDNKAARDYARLSRVPGFLHAGTGVASSLEYIGKDSSWDWKAELAEVCDHDYEPTSNETQTHWEVSESSISEYDRDRINGKDVLFPEVQFPLTSNKSNKSKKKDEEYIITKTAHTSNTEIYGGLESPPRSRGTTGLSGLLFRTRGTSVVRATKPQTFLDDIEDCRKLLRTGLPGRGVRMKLHKVVFSAARVFGWAEDQLKCNWKKIIELNPDGTDKDPDKAVESMLGDWRANKGYSLYLPDVSHLPEIPESEIHSIEARLEGLGCAEPHKAYRIITIVLLKYIQTLPVQCMQGTVGLQSRELRNATNTRKYPRGYQSLWEWMQSVNIVTCTEPKYISGKKTREYRINIPMVIWLCGYKTAELDWNPVKRNWWPELSRMQVINDGKEDYGAEETELHSTGWRPSLFDPNPSFLKVTWS